MTFAASKTATAAAIFGMAALGLAAPSSAATWFLDTTAPATVQSDVTGAVKSSYNTSSIEFPFPNSNFTFTKLSPMSISIQFASPDFLFVTTRMIVFMSGTTRLGALQYSVVTVPITPAPGQPWLVSFGATYTDATNPGGLPQPINQTREQQVAGDYVLPEFGAPQGLVATLRFAGGAPVGGVPEPASWAMLIAGFGLTGAAMRRRRQLAA